MENDCASAILLQRLKVPQFSAVSVLFSDVVNNGALLVFAGEIFDHPGHLPQPLARIDHLQHLLFIGRLDVQIGRHDERKRLRVVRQVRDLILFDLAVFLDLAVRGEQPVKSRLRPLRLDRQVLEGWLVFEKIDLGLQIVFTLDVLQQAKTPAAHAEYVRSAVG